MRSMPSRLITYSILQDQQDANVIYLGTNLGVYRSLDRGTSWAPIWAPTTPDETLKKKSTKGKRKEQPAKRAPRAKGPDEVVRRAQEALNSGGYSVGAADGRAGTQTLTALKRFQSDRHLPVSGKFDDLTLAALGISRTDAAGDGTVILTDAVNAMVQVPDAQTGRLVFLAATNTGLFRSSEPAKGWKRLPFATGFDPRITCIATNASNPDIIWVGTAASGALVSKDGGNTWNQSEGLPADAPVNTIAQDSQQPNFVYVGTKQAFYASHDGGMTWSRRGGNLPFGDFTSILINPRNGDEIFVGNAFQNGEIGGGVYRTVNAGLTWARIDPREHRLPSQRIWSLAFDSQEQNTLFVGSHSAGVYVVPRGSVSLSTASQ
jgi:photosystem II stability/assembly factor-like uncharacterized protein